MGVFVGTIPVHDKSISVALKLRVLYPTAQGILNPAYKFGIELARLRAWLAQQP